jgi:hypothetical protein
MNYTLSLSDIVTALKLSGEKNSSTILGDERMLKVVLWNMGLDVNHSFTDRQCKHRNMQGQIADCIRYEGSERSDPAWLSSGHATERNSDFANSAQEACMPNVSSTTSEYHLNR